MSVFKKGSIVADKYVLIKVLGEGEFGCVWRAKDLFSSEEVAIKKAKTIGLTDFKQEYDNLMKIGDSEAATFAPTPYEYLSNLGIIVTSFEGNTFQNLHNSYAPFSTGTICLLIFHAFKALEAFHESGFSHHDLHWENIALGKSDEKARVVFLDLGTLKTATVTRKQYDVECLLKSLDMMKTGDSTVRMMTRAFADNKSVPLDWLIGIVEDEEDFDSAAEFPWNH